MLGYPLPADLPPPPLPHSGWADRPYTETWVLQMNQFLSNHSRQFARVNFTTSQNVAPENLNLSMAEGWQSSTNLGFPIHADTNAP